MATERISLTADMITSTTDISKIDTSVKRFYAIVPIFKFPIIKSCCFKGYKEEPFESNYASCITKNLEDAYNILTNTISNMELKWQISRHVIIPLNTYTDCDSENFWFSVDEWGHDNVVIYTSPKSGYVRAKFNKLYCDDGVINA